MDFLGLDIETIKGRAKLICLSDGRFFKVNFFEDILKFFKTFKSQNFLSYNADYDIQSLLVYFPERVLDELLLGIRLNYQGMSFQYIKNKFLKFGSNYIFDSYQYCKESLAVASERILGLKKLDVDASKINVKNIYSPQTIAYCIQDALLSFKLFKHFYDGLPEKLKTVKPISTAYYAAKYFEDELRENRVRQDINLLFRKGYHGGRFEIYQKGYFQKVFVYDINSAYPFEIMKLKGLKSCKILKLKEYIRDADFSLYYVRVNLKDKYVSPVVYKYKGLSLYPVGDFGGYVTKGEYERILRMEPEILSAVHVFGNTTYPFERKIKDLYYLKQVSKSSEVYKIMLNSLYGKTCQRTKRYVKDAEGEIFDVYQSMDDDMYMEIEDISRSNFLYASEITARTRLRLYDLVRKYPQDILAVQTDSVISLKELDLPLSSRIGEWKKVMWKEAYLLGSGIYFFRKNDIWEAKIRGFNLKGERAERILFKILKSKKDSVEFDTLKRFSIQEARRIHQEDIANQILSVIRTLNINFDKKRVWLEDWSSGEEIRYKKIKSLAIYLYRDLKISS